MLQQGHSNEAARKMRTLTQIVLASALATGINSSCAGEYGCDRTGEFEKTGENTYEGEVDSRFYKHDTGVIARDGDYMDINVSGKCCWQSGSCGYPDGTTEVWGAYWMFQNVDKPNDRTPVMKLGHGFKGNIELPRDGRYKLYLVIPELDDKERCQSFYHQDNSGEYDVTVTHRPRRG
jgi:hypothetical protein